MQANEIAMMLNDEGVSLKTLVVEGVRISERAARKLLAEGGYQYNRSTKKWEIASDGEIDSHGRKAASIKGVTPVTLSNDEWAALKDLAQQLVRGNANVIDAAGGDYELYERSRQLDKSENVRKTYVVDESIAARFDALTDRCKLDKSELLTLALTDFLNRYE